MERLNISQPNEKNGGSPACEI